MGERVREVTLMELLDSRETRVLHQRELLAEYGQAGGVLVSVTLNIPGPVKDNPRYRRVMAWAMEQLASALLDAGAGLLYREVRNLVTGSEGYLISAGLTEAELKRLAVAVEDSSDLGRILDVDIVGNDGGISRKDLGLSARKCLLCGEDAKVCARSQRHAVEELLSEIDRIIEEAELNKE